MKAASGAAGISSARNRVSGDPTAELKAADLGAGAERLSWFAVLSVYGGGFIIGATLDSFPASSAYVMGLRGLSDVQYGSIYIPQLIAATTGAVLGGAVSRRLGLPRLFKMSVICFLVAQALLTFCGWPAVVLSAPVSVALLMAGTAAFGFGFGFGGGPLNGLVAELFPKSSNTAITAFHMCAGAGLAVSPFVFSRFAAAGHWTAGILALSLLSMLVLALALMVHLPAGRKVSGPRRSQTTPARSKVFWLLAAAAIAYALVEGTFSNWAIVFVQRDLQMSPSIAADALAAFWGGLTLGRLGGSVLALRFRPIVFLSALPALMIVALFLVRAVDSPLSAIASFAIAGVSCSAFFPMLVGFAAEDHPDEVSWLASMLTAALMTGVGLGSYAIGSLRSWVAIRDLYAGAVIYPVIALTLILIALRVRRSVRGAAIRA